nr:hypothetical protein [uncultured Draconibacterium sp.]
MKTINLYFDFEFTSLSPDAQPISLGIVGDTVTNEFVAAGTAGVVGVPKVVTKSFYAEFSDFDINRCDDWVKENVISRLRTFKAGTSITEALEIMRGYGVIYNVKQGNDKMFIDKTELIVSKLKEWLSQFSDYQIQFICDCGTWDWYWLVQLLAEWEIIEVDSWIVMGVKERVKTGLPKLPDNISPVPSDLNDLIALKKGITPKEAFELSREELAYGGIWIVPNTVIPRDMSVDDFLKEFKKHGYQIAKMDDEAEIKKVVPGENFKHNALFDAKVIKEIYQKLK